MAKHVLLDNVTHKDLRIITDRRTGLGDDIGYTLVIPQEFRQVAFNYPIAFRKNSSIGQFEAVALFGLDQHENLFLAESGWQVDYIPLSIERGPFMIGYADERSAEERRAVIHVDMDHSRVNFEEGEAVFLEQGGKTPYLERISSVLAELIRGIDENKHFVDALSVTELLEPFTLKVQLKNGTSIQVKGFYTINEERLRALSRDELKHLHDRNYLELIYLTIASLSNLRKLIKMKQDSL